MNALAALLLVVSAGDYDRIDTPIVVPCRPADLGATAEQVHKLSIVLTERGPKEPTPVFAQWEKGSGPAGEAGNLVFVLPGKLPKGAARTYEISFRPTMPGITQIGVQTKEGQHAEVMIVGKPVLRYNFGLMKQTPDKDGKFDRACYFHPLWAPGGEIITGDFHPNHLHHRGLWFAWVKAKAGDIDANFWEIQQGRGKMVNRDIAHAAGPAFARLTARNDWTSKGKVLIRETMAARVYAVPGGLRVFDLSSRQEAVEADVTLGKIHYGGLGFRGRDEWDGKKATLDVLTSEGKVRKNGNATNARWVDYTGPLGENGWGGILVIEHPSNPRYPNRVRIHPSMCFFSTTLCQTKPYSIRKGEPLVLRYRLVLHDGRPDRALAERLAADLAHPPDVVLKRGK